MKYCGECKRLYSAESETCENCGGALAEIMDDDKVYLITVSLIQKERIKIVLEDNSIELFEEANGRKTDLYLKYVDYDKATDILIDIDALPSDFKDNKKKKIKTVAEIRALEKKKAAAQAEAKKENDNESAADDSNRAAGEKKNFDKAGTEQENPEKKKMFENLLSEDDEKSVYELFGFQNLSRKKRIITAAILWVIFGFVLFLLIAGVDMGMEFLKNLFS